MNTYTRSARSKTGLRVYRDIDRCLREYKLGKEITNRFKKMLTRSISDCESQAELDLITKDVLGGVKKDSITFGGPLLGRFPAPFNQLKELRVSGAEYLMANPDVLDAWKRGAITSWMDHLLSAGLGEFIDGKRDLFLGLTPSNEDTEFLGLKPLVVIACQAADPSAATLTAAAGIEGVSEDDIISYDIEKDMSTCLGNGNKTGGLLELALLADLASRPILAVRNGCRPSKQILHHMNRLRNVMDKKVVIYGDYIAEETKSNKSVYLKGKPFTLVSIFESDITCGIVGLTPYTLLDNRIQNGDCLESSWQELLLGCLQNGTTFWHTQALFGRVAIDWIGDLDIRYRLPLNPFPFPVKQSDSANDSGEGWPRLSQESLEKATQLIEDGSNSALRTYLRSRTVSVVIFARDNYELLASGIKSILCRADLPSIRVIALVFRPESKKARQKLASIQEGYKKQLVIHPIPKEEYNGYTAFNYLARQEASDFILLYGSGIEIKSDWAIAKSIAYHYLYNADITGARIHDATGLVHHNGLALAYPQSITVVSPGKGYLDEEIKALCPSQSVVHECIAVSSEFLLISKERLLSLGGMDQRLDPHFGELDLCLRSNENGGRTICITEPILSLSDQNEKSFRLRKRTSQEEQRELIIRTHAPSFRSRDPFHYGELYDNKIHVHCGKDNFLVRGGRHIELNEIYQHNSNEPSGKRIAAIFVHFDPSGELGDDVIFYLENLRQVADIFFVSSSVALCLNTRGLTKLKELVRTITIRMNSGYDFGCWSHVIQTQGERLFNYYETIILCNDSVIGPIHDLSPILDRFIESKADFGGLTASTAPAWHLQSYFLIYKRSVFSDPVFRSMWNHIREHPTKNQLIDAYEVTFSRLLMRRGYNPYVIFDAYINDENNTHLKWKELLADGFPFVKKELVRDNPLDVDIDSLDESVGEYNNQAKEIISAYRDYAKQARLK